jgi:acyl carrier protein
MDMDVDVDVDVEVDVDAAPSRADVVTGISDLLAEILGLGERRQALTADTELFGALPELDSLSVLELATALEEKYDVVIEDEDFTGEVFATIGSLADFIESRST